MCDDINVIVCKILCSYQSKQFQNKMYLKIFVFFVCLHIAGYIRQMFTKDTVPIVIIFTIKIIKPNESRPYVIHRRLSSETMAIQPNSLKLLQKMVYALYIWTPKSKFHPNYTLGYIISLYRIPPETNTSTQVVFLMHGMLVSAVDFLVLGPDQNKALGED